VYACARSAAYSRFALLPMPLNVASASGMPPYMIDRHQPALHESSKVKSPCHIPTVAS